MAAGYISTHKSHYHKNTPNGEKPISLALLLMVRTIINARKKIPMNSTKCFFIILSFIMGIFFCCQAIRLYLIFTTEFETSDYLIIKFYGIKGAGFKCKRNSINNSSTASILIE
jgi:hypothetical protein